MDGTPPKGERCPLTTESGLDGEYVPSPTESVRTQVADYEASGGVKGATLEVGRW